MGHSGNSFRALAAGVILIAIAVAGCGGSSKPGYCTARANLNKSVSEMTSLSPSSGISELQSQFRKLQDNATAVVNSARSDFPNETSAISSSMDQLNSAVQALRSNPSATQIGAVVSSASRVASSVRTFSDATRSKCG